jgi:deoxycytidine triphosphate deaminase
MFSRLKRLGYGIASALFRRPAFALVKHIQEHKKLARSKPADPDIFAWMDEPLRSARRDLDEDPAGNPKAAQDLSRILGSRAETFLEAQARYRRWQRIDPFPEIEPALLNSADFCNYITTTGMLHPFTPDIKQIKLAAIELRVRGPIVYWDEHGKRAETNLQPGKEPFVLCANSIAFVTIEPYLQIPEYIALRFNLRVSHVYRGLLLGTGPLIDPGYQGWLSVPLHNLTTNDYLLYGGEPLIAVEFTKVSPMAHWKGGSLATKVPRHELYAPYADPSDTNPKTTERNVSSQVRRADPNRGIRSSLAPMFKLVRDAEERLRAFTILAVLAALTGLVPVSIALYNLTGVANASRDASRSAQMAISQDSSLRVQLKTSLDSVSARASRLERAIAALRDTVAKMKH